MGGGIAQNTGSVVMKLTGTKVAEAKPADRERKLSDGGGWAELHGRPSNRVSRWRVGVFVASARFY